MSTHCDRKFRYVFHLSDIHIQNAERYRSANLQAFSLVADAMKRAISDKQNEEALIVIVGDLFHHNNRFGVGDISDAKRLLSAISEIAPVIIIPGNHDMNLNNKDEDDLVADFIRSVGQNLPNVFYYPNSGVYVHGNINFIHLSLRDMEVPQVPIGDNINIALAHETIKGAKVGTDVSCGGASSNPSISRALNHGRFGKDLAQKYDYVFLGHVHEMQFIAPNMAYCGSLIQHSTGESPNKGFLLWDLCDASAEFIPIETDYGYVKLIIENDQIPQDIKLPRNVIKSVVEYKNCSGDALKTLGETLYDKTGITPLFVDRTCYEKNLIQITGRPPLIDHFELLKGKLGKMNLSEKEQAEVIGIHKENWGAIHTRGALNWRIVSLEWDFLSCYGAGNYINFEEIDGITGIIAENGTGKSSVVEIILMALFGKTSSGDYLKEMKNKTSGSGGCMVRIKFRMDSVYIIERKLEKTSATCSFFEEREGGLKNLTKRSVSETNEAIKRLIGDQDDYLYTIICSQYDTHNFANMKPSERRDKIFEIFNMDAFVQIEKDTSKKIRSLREEIKCLEESLKLESNVESELEQAKASLSTLGECLRKCKEDLLVKQAEKEEELKNNTITGLSLRELQGRIKELQEYVRGKEKPEQNEQELYERLYKVDPPTSTRRELTKEIQRLKTLLGTWAPPDMLPAEQIEALQKEKNTLEKAIVYSENLIAGEGLGSSFDSLSEHIKSIKEEIARATKDVDGQKHIEIDYEEEREKLKREEREILLKRREVENIRAEKLLDLDAKKKRLLELKDVAPNTTDYAQIIELIRSEIDKKKTEKTFSELHFDDACASCQKNRVIVNRELIEKEAELAKYEEEQKKSLLAKEREAIELELKGDLLVRSLECLNESFSSRQERLRQEDKRRALLRLKERSQKLSQMSLDIANHKRLREVNFALQSALGEYYTRQDSVAEKRKLQSQLSDKLGELANLELYEENLLIKEKLKLLKAFEELAKKTKELSSKMRLASIEEDISHLQEDAEGYLRETIKRESAKSALAVKYENLQEMKKRKEKLKDQLYLQGKYVLCMDRVSGIPGEYLESIVRHLQEYSNKILEQFTSLSLKFIKKDTDKQTKLNINVEHLSFDKKVINYSDLSQASGYQKFACGIAIRIALQIILNEALGDFLVIDEGFSSSDENNRRLVQEFIKNIKSRFHFVFIISHLEEFKEIIEVPLIIENRAGKSLINYGSRAGATLEVVLEKDKTPSEDCFEKVEEGQIFCKVCKKYLKEKSKLAHANTKGHKSKI